MYKKIASNTITQIISKALTAIISIFLIAILTKSLPVELYGSYNKVFSYLGIFAFLSDLGLYTIAVREISKTPKNIEKIIGNTLTLRVGLGFLVWILSLLIALILPGYSDVFTFTAIAIIGAFTLISLINSSLLALMQSQMKMEFSLVSLLSGKILNLALVSYFLLFLFEKNPGGYLGFISIFFAATLGIALTTFLNFLYARKICKVSLRFDRDYIWNLFKISLPYGIALFLSVVYFKIDVILLSILEDPQKADVSIALYGLPMKIVEVLMVLGGFYLNSILPSLSNKYSQKKYSEISKMLGLSLKVLCSGGLFIFIAGNIFKTDIISIIATQEYLEPVGRIFNSADVLSIVFAVLLFHFIALAFIYILIAAEKQSLLLKINIIITLVNIVGNILLIPYYSFMGAAVVTLISQIILMCVSYSATRGIIKLPMKYIGELFKSFLIALLIFMVFSYIIAYVGLGSIANILIFGPSMLIIYGFLEFRVSKKLLKNL